MLEEAWGGRKREETMRGGKRSAERRVLLCLILLRQECIWVRQALPYVGGMSIRSIRCRAGDAKL